MSSAVFLDRDGVINTNLLNKATGEWESPYQPQDLKLFPWTLQALKKLQDHHLQLFLISNQPSFAKGTASLKDLKSIQDKLHVLLIENKIFFVNYYYCFHHPQGIVPELAVTCECRKPGTFFIEKAVKENGVDLKSSWIIGDRETDIECGQRAGLKTIRIINPEDNATIKNKPDYQAANLREAVNFIIGE